MSSGGRVSIPNNVRKMILSIKEINGNHTEEEIYLMLKECNMDPNETAQKLLFQDTFHEVKRKKDRRKENLGNKESVESRWRPGVQGRGSRGGRGNHTLRSVSNDGSGGRNALGKENGLNQVPEKGTGLSSVPTTQDTKDKEIAPATSSLTVNSNGPSAMVPGSSGVAQVVISSVEGVGKKSEDFPAVRGNKLGNLPPDQVSGKEKANEELEKGHLPQKVTSSSSNSHILPSSPSVYFSASDPVLVPSHDPRVPNAVGAIKREVGSQRTPVEQTSLVSSEATSTAASEVRSSSMQGKISNKSIGRSQQVLGPQKVSPSKEWKPKPTNTNPVEGFEAAGLPQVPVVVKADIQPCHELGVLDSEKGTSKLQKNLEEFHISNSQHVIIPDHLHVPDAEKLGFCFGSFDASFDLQTGYTDSHENETNPAARSETSESVEEMAVHSLSNQDASATTEEGDFPEHSQSPRLVPRNLSSHDGDSAPALIPEFSESKQETELQPGAHQYPVIHTSPNYSFGFMPPMVGTQLAPFENESQTREGSRLPSFIIQQPIDPAAYYAQFYRSGADSDGRVSPFHSAGATTKYTGSTEVLSSQTSQSAQENGSSVLSTGGPSPIVTQPTGLMQSSLAVPQQQLPLFRQPTGIPIPHYPPTYLPYGHYFPQFYMPPPAIHQFLSNGAFPQQSQAGSVYPAPPGATAKYSLPQYKAGNNTGESTHVGGAGSYAQYGSSPPTAYNTSSTSASTANEDLSAPQLKEGNPHILGQQNEGSAAWIFPPGRDISNLQTSSFYNFPQGQVAFNPSQGGHGNFTNMYHHPAQAVSSSAIHPHPHPLLQQQSQNNVAPAADNSAAPAPTVYQQQPHHAQNNWPSNY